jgi:hypothetical protein
MTHYHLKGIDNSIFACEEPEDFYNCAATGLVAYSNRDVAEAAARKAAVSTNASPSPEEKKEAP